MTAIKVRFAPSPTGRLHVGNLRTALVNYLFAHKMGGQFMLRIDDTDTERSTAAFEADIRADLEWMSMGWDCEDRQSLGLRDMMKLCRCWLSQVVPMPAMKAKKNYH